MTDELLPALPEAGILIPGRDDAQIGSADIYAFTEAQMRAYAREAIRQQWRPMDSAPMDGTAILVAAPSGHVWQAYWRYVGPRAGSRWESYGLGAVPFKPAAWTNLPTYSPPAGEVA